MRLGIRRKLIGTLMLVGLFPLAMSLVVVLGGGAAFQLNKIRGTYEDTAALCAERIGDALMREELEKVVLISRFPRLVAYVRGQNTAALPEAGGAKVPMRGPRDEALDLKWQGLKPTDPEMKPILDNELSDRLRLLKGVDGHPRQVLVTNATGQVIAADEPSDDYFQADELWWQTAFDGGRGKLYVSSVVHGAKADIVEIALPIYDVVEGKRVLVGILKDKLEVAWLFNAMRLAAAKVDRAQLQLIDLAAGPAGGTGATVYASSGATAGELERAEKFYAEHHADPRVNAFTLLFKDLVVGSMPVTIDEKVLEDFKGAQLPRWVVVVSQPSSAAMTPVYRLAMTVAGIGVALILVLFILGVAISNREIIMPILRWREAAAAGGRGEVSGRLRANEKKDPTFRRDELGELARDFDEMTRQLQKNVNQLARSNEAKRRFMELAGHELRTPVTYLLGVCQLAQKQLLVLQAAATDGGPEDEAAIALAAKNATAITGNLSKIMAKSQRLSRIIDNLLKLVNNDQFTTRMIKGPVDVRALILQVTADHRLFINERKQQLVIDVAENLPSLDADRDKLEDALMNLVSNAIRFSPDGGVVRVAAHEVVGEMLEILVEDSGPGIPPEDLANLFEPFYTGSDILHHHSGTFEYGSKGLGLGLAIVRRFIELHGGIVRAHVLVRDGKTVGTQFQILLPLGRPAEPTQA